MAVPALAWAPAPAWLYAVPVLLGGACHPHEPCPCAHMAVQLFPVLRVWRVALSAAATLALALLGGALLLALLNLQGYIQPGHVHMPWLAALSQPGGFRAQG